jgi:hypothetical protein
MDSQTGLQNRIEQIEDELSAIKRVVSEGDSKVPDGVDQYAWDQISEFGEPTVVGIASPVTFVVDGDGDIWVLDENGEMIEQPPILIEEIEQIAEIARDKQA